VIDSGDPELTRTIVRKRADQVASPRAARQYRNLLLDAGFRDATAEVHTGVFTDGSFLPVLTRLAEVCCEHGAIARAQADAWIAEQRERVQADRLFAAIPFFMAAATSPWRGRLGIGTRLNAKPRSACGRGRPGPGRRASSRSGSAGGCPHTCQARLASTCAHVAGQSVRALV
jgi:hypothetical protein